MSDDKNTSPEEINDEALDDAQGGASTLDFVDQIKATMLQAQGAAAQELTKHNPQGATLNERGLSEDSGVARILKGFD